MAISDILKKILDEAAAEIDRLRAEFQNEKKSLSSESDKILDEQLTAINAKFDSAADDLENKTFSMARSENKKALLNAKQEIIQNAQNAFLKSLESADDKLYGDILTKLFDAKNFPADQSGKIRAPKNRLEITKKFAPSSFEIVADDDIKGGFIAFCNNAEIDRSFQNLVFSEFADDLKSFFADALKLI